MFTPEEVEKIRQLLGLFEKNDLTDLTVKEPDGFSATFSKTPVLVPFAPLNVQSVAPAPHQAPITQPPKHVPVHTGITLNAPMVGIFYSSPAPGEPPFIQPGDSVRIGQTIGMIEAMKVFSEVPAESAGKVIEIVAPNGALVQQGQPLVRLESS